MHCFSFDIETIPDVEFGRRMWGLEDLSDADVGTAMSFMRQQQTGSDFLPLHVQRVVAISVAFRTADTFKIWTLGDRDADEAEIIRRFFEGIERYSPELVSWNGSGFDFHWRHLDLMDVLAGFQMRGRASLDQMAVMLGFPGKLGMSGDKVWERWLDGGIDDIRDYCETDVLNTYLVYLRFEFMRGNLDTASLEKEYEKVRSTLREMDRPHLNEFLAAWAEV
jgi:predicted PolB exonuclease-like 3'-5' exonuclease